MVRSIGAWFERHPGLPWILAAGVAFLPSAFLFVFLLTTPWDVEIVEGFVDAPARRGGGLDASFPPLEPGPLPYPNNYPPFHAMAAGAVARLTGMDSLLAGRALSLAGGMLAVLAVFRLSRFLGATPFASAASGLLVLIFHPMATFLGLDRADGLALGFVMLGASLVVESGGPPVRLSRASAGMLLAAAGALCHQRYVVLLPALTGIWFAALSPADRRSWKAVAPPAAAAIFVVAVMGALQLRTQGRAWFYMVTLTGHVPLSGSMALRIFAESAVLWGLVWAVSAMVAWRLDRSLRWPLLLAALPFLANAYFCLNIGASRNYFLPVTVACLPYLAVGLSRDRVPAWLGKACAAIFLVAAFGHAAWTGAYQIPRRMEQAEIYRRADAVLRTLPGPIFSSNMYAHLSRRDPSAVQTNWPYWVIRSCAPAIWERDSAWLRQSVREGRFSLVLIPIQTLLPLDDADLAVRYRPVPAGHALSRAYGRVYALRELSLGPSE